MHATPNKYDERNCSLRHSGMVFAGIYFPTFQHVIQLLLFLTARLAVIYPFWPNRIYKKG